MENSSIEWCDHTFNPWEGCTKVSPACDNCYAETRALRFNTVQWGHGQPRRRTSVQNWNKPLRWDREAAKTGTRPRVFCASLADVFDTEVPLQWRLDLFDLIRNTPNLDWLLLTKRPAVARKFFNETGYTHTQGTFFYPNVWLGTTVENEKMARARIPHLLETPNVAKRFLSMEPLLESVSLFPWLGKISAGWKKIDWVIVGGESGAACRTMEPAWAEDIMRACKVTGTPFLLKQMTGHTKVERQDIPEPIFVREYPV